MGKNADYKCEICDVYISTPTVIGVIRHEPTMTNINVYKPISKFKAFMLKFCFGFEYTKIK